MKEKKDSEKGVTMEKLVSLCKRRGFVFQGSDIYGGLRGTWDFGPLGVALNNNIKREWWKMFVDGREDMYGLDAAILMNEKVWEASGHTGAGFSDPIVICENCKTRYRADHLVKDEKKLKEITLKIAKQYRDFFKEENLADLFNLDDEVRLSRFRSFLEEKHDRYDVAEIDYLLVFLQSIFDHAISNIDVDIEFSEGTEFVHHNLYETLESFTSEDKNFEKPALFHYLRQFIKCPTTKCEKNFWSPPRDFNLMFETKVGAGGTQKSYLRPETAQGIFVNFKNVVDSMSPKIPFGIAQIGKAFRNEIAPREFLFRVREFEQMEIEYFVKEENWEDEYEKLLGDIRAWHKHLGLSDENLKEVEVEGNDLAHYSKRTIDFEYNYPGKGFDELAGFAYRTDHDLKNHMEASGVSMEYIEPDGSRFVPHVLEPSFGVGRALTAVLAEAYTEDTIGDSDRTYLKLPAHLAPYRVAVSPLLRNKPQLVEKAREVFTKLKAEFGNVAWDDNGNVGKRYRRQDEIGTPYCIVIDFETLGEEDPDLKDTVTVRDRDTGEQERVKIEDLIERLK